MMGKVVRLESLLRGGASIAALAIAVTGGNAYAQTAPDAQAAPDASATAPAADPQAAPEESAGGDIVITGFRGSLVKALDQKKQSATAIDSILAEDIGKFPDLNLSESIQRIPGVALARDGGEGRQISVRGTPGANCTNKTLRRLLKASCIAMRRTPLIASVSRKCAR